MPYQDQLYVGYVPTDWDDLCNVVGKFERDLPKKIPNNRNEIIDKVVNALDESNPLGTIHIEEIGDVPVALYLPSWDADDEEEEALTKNPETKKLWCMIGVQLTSRYFPRILDKEYANGRPDFFAIDIEIVNKIRAKLFEFLKLPTELVLMVQFY